MPSYAVVDQKRWCRNNDDSDRHRCFRLNRWILKRTEKCSVWEFLIQPNGESKNESIIFISHYSLRKKRRTEKIVKKDAYFACEIRVWREIKCFEKIHPSFTRAQYSTIPPGGGRGCSECRPFFSLHFDPRVARFVAKYTPEISSQFLHNLCHRKPSSLPTL